MARRTSISFKKGLINHLKGRTNRYLRGFGGGGGGGLDKYQKKNSSTNLRPKKKFVQNKRANIFCHRMAEFKKNPAAS